MMTLFGMDVRECKFLSEARYVQVCFPKSKGKRIRKKWRKDKKKNWAWDPGMPVLYKVEASRNPIGQLVPAYIASNPVAYRMLLDDAECQVILPKGQGNISVFVEGEILTIGEGRTNYIIGQMSMQEHEAPPFKRTIHLP